MSLSARAIAVSGIGFTALLVGASGLLGVQAEVPAVELTLESAGFKPLRAAVSHSVPYKVHTRVNLIFPHAVTKIIIAADSQFISCPRIYARIPRPFSVDEPFTGLATPKLRWAVVSGADVWSPSAGSVPFPVSVRSYTSGAGQTPICGTHTPAVAASFHWAGYIHSPEAIQNIPEELLTLI